MALIKFTSFGANSAFGSFAPGDTMRCSDDLARHLVEEIQCAKYDEVKAQPVAVEPVEVTQKRTRKAK